MVGEVLDFLARPASPETIDFTLNFLDPGRGAGAKSAKSALFCKMDH